MLDVAVTRESFRDEVIYDIRFVRSDLNVARGLTKPMKQKAFQDVI